jgi:hypothetical protein
MSEYSLHVCKPFEMGDWRGQYRFVVVDQKCVRGFPANFICMLPKRIYDKGKPPSVFGRIFGDNSYNYAVKLLLEALQNEKDDEVKFQLKKRLRLIARKLSCLSS